MTASDKAEISEGAAQRLAGFVLLSVLVVTTLISFLALGTAITIRSQIRKVDAETQSLRARTLADAGITRIIAALEASDDPLLATLQAPPYSTSWRYADTEIHLSLGAEAGKVDLNTGHSELVHNVTRAIVKNRVLAEAILTRWADFRRRKKTIEAVDILLAPQDRFTDVSNDLEKAFTTFSGASGIDPLAAPEIVLRHVPGIRDDDLAIFDVSRRGIDLKDFDAAKARYRPMLDGARPLYRLRTVVSLASGATARREALVAKNADTGKIRIIFWRDTAEGTPR
ncbi:type II secretion system GspH family protein [Microvirga terricola]|uniref:Type II secretion system protein n=1 Tax=Microvirga terricola TaxID=2719797 RepID=A0ABX0VH06_9HYPH|nr:type II secretion system GspH family protein [Microvirga terricola]NIX78440.1 type II secretion system protein [Microvirga terricola]